jgi:hypothetical protein
MTLKTYRTEYPAFTGQTEYNQTKKIGGTKVNRKQPPKFDPATLDKWRPTLDGSRKYLSDNLNEICLR